MYTVLGAAETPDRNHAMLKGILSYCSREALGERWFHRCFTARGTARRQKRGGPGHYWSGASPRLLRYARLGVVVTTGLTTAVAGTLTLVAGTAARGAVLAGATVLAVVVTAAVAGAGGSLGLVDAVEANLALLVDLEDADLDLVADVEDVLDLVDAALGNAADVQQAVLAGK